MKHFQLIPSILFCLLFSGCNLEDVPYTDSPCPPRDEDGNLDEDTKLEYISQRDCTSEDCKLGDFKFYFEYGFCPENYPLCTPNADNSNYHCDRILVVECTPPKLQCQDDLGALMCVDAHDSEYCGATSCEDLGTDCTKLANRRCQFNEREDQYQCMCNNNATYCEESDTCAVLKTDPENCGVCGHQCEANQLCERGECIDADCESKCKIKENDSWMCVNRDNACGIDCDNCLDASENAYCKNGKCVIDECPKETHPEYRKGELIRCINNTAESCGPNTMTPEDEAVDCTESMPENATKMGCTKSGKCKIVSCKTGYALTDGACKRVSCEENQYLDGNTCKDYVSKCDAKQHISPDRKSCVDNTNKACAPQTSNRPVDCTQTVAKYCNSKGECACSTDNSTVLNYDKTTCIRKACKGIYGVTESTKDTDKDYCVPTACSKGFQVDGSTHWGVCRPIATSVRLCDALNLPGWKKSKMLGDSTASGLCQATECEAGYSVFHGTCQPSNNACGGTGYNCEVQNKKCSGDSTSEICVSK